MKFDTIVAHNVTAEAGILLAGDPTAAIEDVSLSNIFIDYEGGGTAQDAERVVPEYEDNGRYPEPFRLGRLSSWGLFARHMKNLTVDRVEFRTAKDDLRPAVRLDDVVDASFDRVKLPPAVNAPTFVLKDVTGFAITNSTGIADTKRPEKIAGEKL
jgi:hypothetical protein